MGKCITMLDISFNDNPETVKIIHIDFLLDKNTIALYKLKYGFCMTEIRRDIMSFDHARLYTSPRKSLAIKYPHDMKISQPNNDICRNIDVIVEYEYFSKGKWKSRSMLSKLFYFFNGYINVDTFTYDVMLVE